MSMTLENRESTIDSGLDAVGKMTRGWLGAQDYYEPDFDSSNKVTYDHIEAGLEKRDMRFALSYPVCPVKRSKRRPAYTMMEHEAGLHQTCYPDYQTYSKLQKDYQTYSKLQNEEQLLSENIKLLEQLKFLEEKERRWIKEKEILQSKLLEKNRTPPPGFNAAPLHKRRSYPSNVIPNLIKSQLEFYFSEYHLKRDKVLLEKLCDCKTYKGFLPFEEICQLSKIRTLGQERSTVLRALEMSEHLKFMEKDGVMYVGRENFEKPKQMEFPFRRTVFAYGIPLDKDENWVRQQFECFGGVNKIQFDSGSKSTKRKVGARLLNQEKRVSKLFSDANKECVFQKKKHGDTSTFVCRDCQKLKKFSEGCYVSALKKENVFCIQCAAKQAEKRNVSLVDSDSTDEELFIDSDSSGSEDGKLTRKFKTCLIVYDSQRQASKCVYVRSRLGIEGCFAAHFHQFTKEKKFLQSSVKFPGKENKNVGPLSLPVMKVQKSSPIHTDYKSRAVMEPIKMARRGSFKNGTVPHYSQFLPGLSRRPFVPRASSPLFSS